MKSITFCSTLILTIGALLAMGSTARADQQAINDAKKEVVYQQGKVKDAQAAYDKAKDAVKAQLAKTPEYADALKALSAAKLEVDKATKPALDRVHASTDYIAAKKAFDDNDALVKSLQVEIHGGAAKGNELAAASLARNNAKTKMEQLENDAVSSDPKIQAAQKQVTSAQAKIDELDSTKLPPLLEADQPCIDAKKALDDAQAKLADAKKTLADAIKQAKDESKSHSGGGAKGSGMGGHKGG